MNKIIQRPLACRNAHCGAMCSLADAEFWGSYPSKCPNYERRDDLYRKTEILDKVKQAREEVENLNLNDYGDNLYQFQAKCTAILDKLIESEE